MDTITYFEMDYNNFTLDAFTNPYVEICNLVTLHKRVEKVSEMNLENKKFFVIYDPMDSDNFSIKWLRLMAEDEVSPPMCEDDLYDFLHLMIKKLRIADALASCKERPTFCLVQSYKDLLAIFEEKERRKRNEVATLCKEALVKTNKRYDQLLGMSDDDDE